MNPPLQGFKSFDLGARDWMVHNRTHAAARHGRNETIDLRHVTNSGGRTLSGFEHFPFRVYTLPFDFASADDDNWRKFRVRSGILFMSDGPVYPDKTDGAGDPWADTYPDLPDGTDPIEVDADTAAYYIWIEVPLDDPGSSTIKHGADPTANGWDDFPGNEKTSTIFLPIAQIDTTTRPSSILQFLVGHLYLPFREIIFQNPNDDCADWHYYAMATAAEAVPPP